MILLIICNGSQLVFSQKIQQKYFTVYINNPEDSCSIKAEVYNKKMKIRYCDTLKYYWYAANKIIATQGASDGKIVHGKFSSFYYSNKLKEQGRFKKGLKTGRWMKWNSNGNLQETVNWHNGFRHGRQSLFDSAGAKIYQAKYCRGKLDGTAVNYSNGKAVSQKKFKNGLEVPVEENKNGESPKNKFSAFWEKIKNRFHKSTSTNEQNGLKPAPNEKKTPASNTTLKEKKEVKREEKKTDKKENKPVVENKTQIEKSKTQEKVKAPNEGQPK